MAQTKLVVRITRRPGRLAWSRGRRATGAAS